MECVLWPFLVIGGHLSLICREISWWVTHMEQEMLIFQNTRSCLQFCLSVRTFDFCWWRCGMFFFFLFSVYWGIFARCFTLAFSSWHWLNPVPLLKSPSMEGFIFKLQLYERSVEFLKHNMFASWNFRPLVFQNKFALHRLD